MSGVLLGIGIAVAAIALIVGGALLGMVATVDYATGQFWTDLTTPKPTKEPRRSLLDILRGRW